MTILALDLGTSTVKFLRTGADLAIRSLDRVPAPGLRVEAWLEALRRNLADHGDGEEIDVLAITGQMHGLITLEEKGYGDGIPWTDQRGAPIAATLNAYLGPDIVTQLGGPLAPGFLGVSLAWIKANDPDRWQRIRKAMLPKDALIHALTGRHLTDPTDAVGTGLFDVTTGSWHAGIIGHLGIPHGWLPEIVPSGTDLGSLTRSVAEWVGLAPETRVVIAGGDAPAGIFGSGIAGEHEALLLLSSGAQVILPSKTFSPDPDGRWYMWPSMSDGFLRVGTLLNAGNAMSWANEIVGNAEAAHDGPTSLIALPHLIGERIPLRDANLRGGILGLTSSTTPTEINAAMREGVAYAIRHILDVMCKDLPRPEIIHIGGGGTNIPGWQQVITDILGIPTRRIAASELTALGAATLAAGTQPNPALDPSMTPDPARERQYDTRYHIYRDALAATHSISRRLATLDQDETP